MSQELFTPYVFGVTYFLAVIGVTAILCMIMKHLPECEE